MPAQTEARSPVKSTGIPAPRPERLHFGTDVAARPAGWTCENFHKSSAHGGRAGVSLSFCVRPAWSPGPTVVTDRFPEAQDGLRSHSRGRRGGSSDWCPGRFFFKRPFQPGKGLQDAAKCRLEPPRSSVQPRQSPSRAPASRSKVKCSRAADSSTALGAREGHRGVGRVFPFAARSPAQPRRSPSRAPASRSGVTGSRARDSSTALGAREGLRGVGRVLPLTARSAAQPRRSPSWAPASRSESEISGPRNPSAPARSRQGLPQLGQSGHFFDSSGGTRRVALLYSSQIRGLEVFASASAPHPGSEAGRTCLPPLSRPDLGSVLAFLSRPGLATPGPPPTAGAAAARARPPGERRGRPPAPLGAALRAPGPRGVQDVSRESTAALHTGCWSRGRAAEADQESPTTGGPRPGARRAGAFPCVAIASVGMSGTGQPGPTTLGGGGWLSLDFRARTPERPSPLGAHTRVLSLTCTNRQASPGLACRRTGELGLCRAFPPARGASPALGHGPPGPRRGSRVRKIERHRGLKPISHDRERHHRRTADG